VILRREKSTKLQELLEVPDADLAGQLDEDLAELGDELAQRGRRAVGPAAPVGRARVAVDEAVPLDDQPGELRAPGSRAPRCALEQRGRRGGSEEVGECVPEDGEEGGSILDQERADVVT
jgi:hypothetical protein